MLLYEALQEFSLALAGEVSDATRTWYAVRLARLRDHLGDRPVKSITTADLRRCRLTLVDDGDLSPWTIHGCIRATRRLFAWLVEEGYIDSSPADRLKLPPLPDPDPKAVSVDDLVKLLDAARHSARDYALVRVLAATGARVGGICGLALDDLELGHPWGPRIHVWEKGKGGSGKARVCYLDDETAAALAVYLKTRPAGDPHVFQGQRGPLTTTGVHQALKRLGRAAGVTGPHNPHAFRHMFARECLKNGAELSAVSRMLGHSSVVVTSQFYGRYTGRELQEQHRRCNPFNGQNGVGVGASDSEE